MGVTLPRFSFKNSIIKFSNGTFYFFLEVLSLEKVASIGFN